ncbi:penicillin-binding protein 2b [Gracilibacillus halophilus YIM-C55.5]|uniref:serine-type D-Ala-D-Ala carboxypeptidase n=1 Tax=Gracilibacillus halophilus YIM-C55.5 TaxID=1308866 RepID=N4WWN5_9BACI|nr:penicillin-binding protein 2 [Gracilibacillus halophilus]ENH97481.1 penicillin-binding protein 2b [Gracilibacillus halophilus YIM-C55.5]
MKFSAIKKNRQKKKKSQLPLRLNILFVSVFLLFSLLIVQLGVVQILNGEEAQQEVDKTENTPSQKPVPRGEMYDADHNVVVDNDPVRSITYTPPKNGQTGNERLQLARDLAEYITIIKDEEELEEEITERNKKEYWYLLEGNQKIVNNRLTEEEQNLDTGDKYQAELDHITEDDLAEVEWSNEIYNVIAIKKELDAARGLSPHIVVNEGLTEEEYAKVATHLNQLPNIDATTDWKRQRSYENLLNGLIGGITSQEEGIPQEDREYYLANGYARNDRVGTSGLEQSYEDVLRGRKEKVQYVTNSDGDVIRSDVVVEGQRGKDLVLTVDMDLQQKVDEIVEDELRKAIDNPGNNTGFLEDATAVMMNPQTGEILAMSATHYDREEDEFKNQAYRTVYDAHAPGSAIKGATVLTGYDNGVIDIGTRLNEKEINIAGEIKDSYSDLGSSNNDLQALQKSSNVYMMRIAIALNGYNYTYGQPLALNPDAFQIFRNHFNQFGLGTETGIDLPFEATGYVGPSTQYSGLLLDFSIGQYDTYTTLQLAQYVSTIANDGYRLKPRLVSEIREPSNDGLGPIIEKNNPEVLNHVDMEQEYIDRVQEGFRRVFTRGTASGAWAGFPYEVAGKTGTAENPQYKDGKEYMTENLSLVGYTPTENPEMAFAVIVPKNGTSTSRNSINHDIGKRIVEAYYESKEE